jgi:hypothetical protein
MTERQLDTPYALFEIRNGIFYLSYKQGLVITHDIALEIVRLRLQFSENTAFPLLITDHGILGMDKSARDWFSSEEGTCQITACALVLNTVYSRVLGNFFIKLTRPLIPVKIFNDQARAQEWLNLFIKNPGLWIKS